MTNAPPVRLLADGQSGPIRLWLADPALMFQGPMAAPLDGLPDCRSGIEQVMAAMKLAWPPKDGRLSRLEIAVADDAVTIVSEPQMRQAIIGYCDARIAEAAIDVRLMTKERRRAWKAGTGFLVACILLAAVIERLAVLPAFLDEILVGSLVIAGWVGLWRPLELTLYDWWPGRFRLGLHNWLRQMPVSLVPDPEGTQ